MWPQLQWIFVPVHGQRNSIQKADLQFRDTRPVPVHHLHWRQTHYFLLQNAPRNAPVSHLEKNDFNK